MSVLEFNEIHRAFVRGQKVLDGVSFSLEPGEVVSLLGRNGAGKTTLLHIAMGMLAPQQGAVRAFGLDPRQQPLEVKRRVGFVSEEQILPTFLRVREVIELHRGLFSTWDDDLARQLGDQFEISPRTRVKALSKGQARQLALLCAISHRPELLLLDEPAGGLDPLARREFLETAIDLLNEAGTTILFSSHYMTDVERLAGRIVMLHGGKVLIDNGLDQLREAFCVARVPHAPEVKRERLLQVDGCIGVRRRSESMHAVFRLEPDAARAALERQLGVTDAVLQPAALEEMFIELAGGQR
jgi:ABC-2 type transport system ATP-binding protein